MILHLKEVKFVLKCYVCEIVVVSVVLFFGLLFCTELMYVSLGTGNAFLVVLIFLLFWVLVSTVLIYICRTYIKVLYYKVKQIEIC